MSIVVCRLASCRSEHHWLLPSAIATVLDALHRSNWRGCAVYVRSWCLTCSVEGRQRNTVTCAIRLWTLRELTSEVAINMGRVWIQPPKCLMHDLDFCLEHLVLLVCLTSVIRISLQALKLGCEGAFAVLNAANVVDSWQISSINLLGQYRVVPGTLTLRQDLPLASLSATVRRHSLVQVFK